MYYKIKTGADFKNSPSQLLIYLFIKKLKSILQKYYYFFLLEPVYSAVIIYPYIFCLVLYQCQQSFTKIYIYILIKSLAEIGDGGVLLDWMFFPKPLKLYQEFHKNLIQTSIIIIMTYINEINYFQQTLFDVCRSMVKLNIIEYINYKYIKSKSVGL